jgi:hypothetical protein
MKQVSRFGILVFAAGLGIAPAWPQGAAVAQPSAGSGASPAVSAGTNLAPGPVDLDWTPPALAQLNTQATVKSSFTLDRNMLAAAAALSPDADADTKQAIGKIDGVSIHMLRFGAAGILDEAPVSAIRDAYHLRGWKHLVTTSRAGGPIHDGTTDVWLVLDGVNVRGAVVLVESPKSLTLVTMAGNLSPVDLLHLRGHFGIPRFEGDDFKDAKDK